MQECITLKLSPGEIHMLQYVSEGELARKVYSFIYANRTDGTHKTAPSVQASIDYILSEHREIADAHIAITNCLSSELRLPVWARTAGVGAKPQCFFIEERIAEMHEKCVSSMKWREEHPPRNTSEEPENGRIRWTPRVSLFEEEDIDF